MTPAPRRGRTSATSKWSTVKTITDYPIATESGDVYFYSPEVLDQAENGVEEPGTSTSIGMAIFSW